MGTALVHVVLEAVDFVGLARFWSTALGWPLLEEFLPYEEGVVRSPFEPALEVIAVPSTRGKPGKNRIHLDLASTTEDDRAALLAGLLEAGATAADIGQGGVPWTVLADPAGNELCVSEAGTSLGDRLGAIVLDAQDVARQTRFWAAATGWSVEAEGDWGAALRHPSGRGPALTMGPPAAAKSDKAVVHLDVAVTGESSTVAEEAARLVRLGAQEIDVGQGDVPWVVLADPEGNELCVLPPR